MKAKTLVLDFGGVISKTLFETHDLNETALGLPPATLTGEISERDYWLQRAKVVGALVGQDWDSRPPFLTAVRGNNPNAVMKISTAAMPVACQPSPSM